MWIGKKTVDLHTATGQFTDVRNRLLKFYGHVFRMDKNIFTKKPFNIIKSNKA